MHGRNRMGEKKPRNAGTGHVGFSSTRQTLAVAPCAKRDEVFGESSRRKGELHPTKKRL